MGSDLHKELVQSAQRFEELRERVSRLVVTETSPDGAVTVTIGADGTLADLVLRDRGLSLDRYAATIMACLRHGQARIPDLVQEAVFATVGNTEPSAHLVLADVRERFPPLEPPPQRGVPEQRVVSAPPALTPVRKPVDDDWEEWEGSQVMDDS